MMEREEDRKVDGGRGASRTIKLVLLGAIAIVAIIFIVKNDQTVDVDYIFGTVAIPLVWGLLATLVLGFIAGWITGSFRRGRNRDRD